MAGSLLPEPKQQFLNDIGEPLFGGQVFTYAAGTLTPKATYQDQALTSLNANPVPINARGEVVMYGTGNYRVILKDAFGSTIYDRDNINILDLSGPTGAENIGNGGETVAQSFAALQYPDYGTLRASTTPRKSVYITGILATPYSYAGYAGFFIRDDTDTTSADNGGTIIVRADGVRYKRAFSGPVNVLWFGVKGDGTTDDSANFQKAINASYVTFNQLFAPTGTYLLLSPLTFPSFYAGLVGEGIFKTGFYYAGAAGTTAFTFPANTGGLGVYRDWTLFSGRPGDSEATARSVARNGVYWKCYGGTGEISNIKAYGFNGFGQKFEAIWDSNVNDSITVSCGNDTEYAWSANDGSDTTNHTNFNRVQIELSYGKAMYFSGLNNVMIGLHSERTVGNGTDFTHIISGDVSVIDSRIEGTSNVKTKVAVATGFLKGLKIYTGPVEFSYPNRITTQAMIEGCNFGGDVSIPVGNLRQYEFKACGFGAAVNIGYAEKQTVFTSCTVVGGMTLTGTGVRVEFYTGSIASNIIQSGGGNNSVEIHDSSLAYYPTTDFVLIFNSDVLNAHTTPFGQKATSFNVIFSGLVTIANNQAKWSSNGCEYKAGIGAGSGSPGWKFSANCFVSGGTVAAGILGAPSGSSAAFSVGERAYRITPAVGQPKSWVCTTAGVSPTLAFTSEGNL